MAINSFPAFHTTGPVLHYIRTNGSFQQAVGNVQSPTTSTGGDIYFLGTCQTRPFVRINRYGQAIFNDLGGRSVPMQKTSDGEDADLAMQLSRYSELAYQRILMANQVTDPAAGVESGMARGSLMYGTKTFELWQWFSFYGTAAATPNMTCGYYWPQVELLNHSPEESGTEGKVLLLTAKATPRFFTPGPGGAANGVVTPARFVLYSNRPADFPADVQVVR